MAKHSQTELRDLVVDAALLQFHPAISDKAFSQSPLGQLMGDVIDVLVGDFDARHVTSLRRDGTRNATQKF